MNFINIFGLIMALGLLIPDLKFPLPSTPKKRFFEISALIGYCGGLFLLSFNIQFLELEYYYNELYWIWMPLGLLLTAGYILCYVKSRKAPKPLFTFGIYACPTLLFLASGLLLGHLLFFPCVLLFLVGCIPDIFHTGRKN